MPLLRKYLSTKKKNGTYTKWILNLIKNKKILSYLYHPKLNEFTQKGPITPDHVNPEAAWPEIGRLREAPLRQGKRLHLPY